MTSKSDSAISSRQILSSQSIVKTDSSVDIFKRKVSLVFYNEPLSKVLPLIVKRFEFEKEVDPHIPVCLEAEEESVSNVLKRFLNEVGLTYVKKIDGIVIQKQPLVTYTAYNQQVGIVIDFILAGYPYSIGDGAENSLEILVSANFNEIPIAGVE
mmetsp:Transcript_5498/g.3152  ORF Transcript_5498/g.3152 Transcript_5498/m.3152 type:complete len:155 (-) Transcript_5498:946-1410(-)